MKLKKKKAIKVSIDEPDLEENVPLVLEKILECNQCEDTFTSDMELEKHVEVNHIRVSF